LPPSCRFPPLREGNRARVRFPLRAGGTLRRGSSIALVFVNCVPAIGIKGVGFFSRGWHGGRDARVPSVARAGSASVSLAWRQKCPARQRREQVRLQKTYPFKPYTPLPPRGRGAGGEGRKQAGHGVLCPYNATPFTSNGEPLGGWAMQRASA